MIKYVPPIETGNGVRGVGGNLAANQAADITRALAQRDLVLRAGEENRFEERLHLAAWLSRIEVDQTSPRLRLFNRQAPAESPKQRLRGGRSKVLFARDALSAARDQPDARRSFSFR